MKKDISLTFLTRILSIIIGMANSIFLTRLLGVEGKGELAIFIASSGFFGMLLSGSLQPSIIFYGSKGQVDYSKLLVTVLIYAALSCVFFCV